MDGGKSGRERKGREWSEDAAVLRWKKRVERRGGKVNEVEFSLVDRTNITSEIKGRSEVGWRERKMRKGVNVEGK